jgi:hypothetical protein
VKWREVNRENGFLISFTLFFKKEQVYDDDDGAFTG